MMFNTMVSRMTHMPMPTAMMNTVFKRPTNGTCIMASRGRSHRAGITSSNPNRLPKRKPNRTENSPQREMMPARLIFLK